jgi:hypothetical protein
LILNLIDKRSDIDTYRASLLARTVGALHTSGGLSHGLFFGVDSVVEVSGPVFFEVNGGSFVSDFIFLSVFLPFLSADNLIFL